MFDPETDMSETLSVRTQQADKIIDDRAMDRMLDDIERYEPTPLVDGPSDNAAAGFICLAVVVTVFVAFGLLTLLRKAVEG